MGLDPSSCYLTGELETVATGLGDQDILGAVLLLHDADGDPYACATVQPDIGRTPLYASRFVPYYTYDTTAYGGALRVAGTVGPMITQAVGVSSSAFKLRGMPAQSFAYDLTGVDPACAAGPTSAPNSCGIHVHEGTSCEVDALGHYYTPAAAPDPWLYVAYTSTADGRAAGAVTGVASGYPSSKLVGRTVLIHDRSGARVACALLTEGTHPQCGRWREGRPP